MRKVAHELRAPLARSRPLSKWCSRPGRRTARPSRDSVARAQRGRGAGRVTQDLLVLSRAREAGLDEARTIIELDALLAEVVADFAQSAERKGVALSADSARSGKVLGDPVAVRQLVANLIENGIRYTPAGGSIAARLRADEGGWCSSRGHRHRHCSRRSGAHLR